MIAVRMSQWTGVSEADSNPGRSSCFDGDGQLAADLLPQVYEELRRLAASKLSRLPPGQTLGPTALVHEAFMRLVREQDSGWNGRGHFFGAAARAMRDILVDQARRKSAVKHGGGMQRLELKTADLTDSKGQDPDDEILLIDMVLTRFAGEFPRQAEIVMLRSFGGLSLEEIAAATGLGLSTVKRDWRLAAAWLRREIERTGHV
ncbi:MAG: sigma-70 family RNA polymerase sigma factor [Phycisphaeraceae bacterium]|nr:sigma-70 family RNA polymerase sigma factor [Phycisphaeraceae bacterium]